jgi:uncharacterized protein YigE (DUF2233 family)
MVTAQVVLLWLWLVPWVDVPAASKVVRVLRHVDPHNGTTTCIKWAQKLEEPESLAPSPLVVLDDCEDVSNDRSSNYAYMVVSTESNLRLIRPPNHTLGRTSQQSREHACRVAAMNAGPFDRNGAPVGLVIDGGSNNASRLVTNHHDQEEEYVAWGWNDTTWVMGRVDTVQEAREWGVSSLVTGFGWLVYCGSNVAANRRHPLRAARSAVGVDAHGRLVWLVADGCEAW